MDRFVRVVAGLSRACGVIAAALIVSAVVVVCQMVAWRYLLALPTIWQTEFVIYALIATTLIGSPYVLLVRGHVNMDILVLGCGPSWRFWLAVAAGVISLVFCALLAVYGAAFWYEAWSKDWHSDTLWRVPLWIPYSSIPLGMGLLTLQLFADFACLLTGRVPPFGLPPESRDPAAVQVETAELIRPKFGERR
jgi:TRAP-type C4-dicarboxylate transport system permease small subunit